jgi:sugar phosphate isomerase/epimerase
MIFLSTGGFSNNTFLQTSQLFNNDIIKAFELSAGQYTDTLENDIFLVKNNFKIALHNYFPVPEIPFVFNLASLNVDIVKKSMEHARNAIVLAAKYGEKFYSFHAGYLIDPDVTELGQIIKNKKLIDRAEGLRQFIKNVNELAIFAKSIDVTLLIENNVVSKNNFESFNCNPLLMTGPEETDYIFSKLPNNVKLLIDVAHLKVSANTLGFDPIKYLYDFTNITMAYHISDNNGLEDSNEPFSEDSWFVDHIRKDLSYYSLEIYVADVDVLESQYCLLTNILG